MALLTVFSVLVLFFPLSSYTSIDDITQAVLNYADNGLGLNEFQNDLEQQTYKRKILNGITVEEIASSTGDRLNVHFQSVNSVKDAIMNSYDHLVTKDDTHPECCGIHTPDYSSILKQNVNFDNWCVHSDQRSPGRYLPTSNILSSIHQHYKEGVKYIYYADENGNYYNYPALDFCGPFEPRLRPWYLQAASSRPNDVIIIIQSSNSMSQVLSIAKAAATNVINSATNHDRFGVIVFNEDAETLQANSETSPCYSNQLAKATQVNRKHLKEYVENLNYDSSSAYFSKAIEKGFQMFKDTPEDVYDKSDRGKIILFLTDGEMSDRNATQLYELIREKNLELDNKVVILTYGLGTDVANVNVLTNMARQTNSSGVIRGEYTNIEHLDEGSDIHKQMASYFTQFKAGTSSDIKIEIYTDAWIEGINYGNCETIHTNDRLRGVLCLDIDVTYAFEYFNSIENTNQAYTFMVDKTWRVFMHPFHPISENDNYYYHSLEGIDNIEDIQTNKTRTSITKSEVLVTKPIRSGTGSGIDVFKKPFNYTYFCHYIENSPLSMCLVVEKGYNRDLLSWDDTMAIPKVPYHQSASIPVQCNIMGKPATRDSTVMLQWSCFTTALKMDYILQPSANRIDELIHYLEGDSSNPGVKNGVRDLVAATYKLNEVWKNSDIEEYILVRYFSSTNGVIRTFPGMLNMEQNYDASLSLWYAGALAEYIISPNNIYITSPHVSDFGGEVVITMSKALDGGYENSHNVIGVLGMDITLESFYFNIVQMNKDCETKPCVILNDAGYIIIRQSWLMLQKDKELFSKERHIAFELPFLAQELIDNNIMVETMCVNVSGNFEEKYFWKIVLQEQTTFDGYTLSISAIKKTNMYLLVVKEIESSNCGCRWDDETCPSSGACHCPCYKSYFEGYQYCASVFTTSALSCAPRLIGYQAASVNDSFGTEKCRKQMCNKNDKRSCNALKGCSYCTNIEGLSLIKDFCLENDAFCSESAICPEGNIIVPPRNMCASESVKSGLYVSPDNGLSALEGGLIGAFVIFIPMAFLLIGFCVYIKLRHPAIIPDEVYSSINLEDRNIQGGLSRGNTKTAANIADDYLNMKNITQMQHTNNNCSSSDIQKSTMDTDEYNHEIINDGIQNPQYVFE